MCATSHFRPNSPHRPKYSSDEFESWIARIARAYWQRCCPRGCKCFSTLLEQATACTQVRAPCGERRPACCRVTLDENPTDGVRRSSHRRAHPPAGGERDRLVLFFIESKPLSPIIFNGRRHSHRRSHGIFRGRRPSSLSPRHIVAPICQGTNSASP